MAIRVAQGHRCIHIPNTAMILPTSTAPIGGLRGSVIKVGVKRILIQRKDQLAYISTTHHLFSMIISSHQLPTHPL
jgi:hypothetical protein